MPEWVLLLFRSLGIFFITLLLVRLMGKRPAMRLTFFDLVTGIAVGVIAAALSLNLIRDLVAGLVALAVWTLLPLFIQFLSVKSKTVRDLVQGKETILINHNKVLEDKLSEARLTSEDLLSRLRRKNIFNFADVEFAVLEPDGEVSARLKKENQPLSPKTYGLKVGQESTPQAVILDGVMMDEALTAMGVNRHWLHTQLEKIGVAPENVFLAMVDSVGQLYLDLFDDAIQVPQPKTKELVYASLKKCQADCELYALGTSRSEIKALYGESSQILAEVINDLEPLLIR